jgi:hypothetical protein
MSTAGIVAGIIITLAVALLTLWPLVAGLRGPKHKYDTDTLESAQVHYDRVLTNIRDLDEDYALGKVQADYYETERAKFVVEGVELLKQIDKLTPQSAVPAAADNNLDDVIEAAIATKRKQQPT